METKGQTEKMPEPKKTEREKRQKFWNTWKFKNR